MHSDLNPKNLLVDPGTLAVTGLVDWEFAHAGSPVTDLGNLLRFERDPAFTEAVVAAYRAGVVDAAEEVLDQARAADLCALVDLASRRGENAVAGRAHRPAPGGRPERGPAARAAEPDRVGRGWATLRILSDAQESA